jgi:hypothetical protein
MKNDPEKLRPKNDFDDKKRFWEIVEQMIPRASCPSTTSYAYGRGYSISVAKSTGFTKNCFTVTVLHHLNCKGGRTWGYWISISR